MHLQSNRKICSTGIHITLTFWILHSNFNCCTKSFHSFALSLLVFRLFLCLLDPCPRPCGCAPLPLQPHPPPLRMYIWSAWAPPASRWVGWHRPPLAATVPLCATQSATRPWLGRTRSGMRWWASAQTPPAMCWKAWRSGLSIRCGWGHTLTWARALRVPRWGWEPKRMVGWHLPLSSQTLLLGAACHYFPSLASTSTAHFSESCWSMLS